MSDGALFLYKIQLVRPEMLSEGLTSDEDRAISDHFQYLQGLTEAAVVILVGRTQNTGYSCFGIVILVTNSIEKARQIMVNDPAVKQRVMCAELYPFRASLLGTLPKP